MKNQYGYGGMTVCLVSSAVLNGHQKDNYWPVQEQSSIRHQFRARRTRKSTMTSSKLMKIRKKMFDLQHRPTNQIDRYVFSITHQSMSHKQ